MHILAGESALRALRAARHRHFALPIPQLTPRSVKVRLPCREEVEPPAPDEDSLARTPTLEDLSFPFESAEANAKVDLWQLGSLGAFTQDRPLELAVFDSGHRVNRKKSRVRRISRSLPADSLVRVNPYLYFVCPELVVLQMASRLTPIRLAQLAMELCGSYSLSPDPELREAAHFQLPAVTTIARIRHYSRIVRVWGGTKTLRQALDLAAEGSASPGETALALAMSLPAELGGYGFPKPSLNALLATPEDEVGRIGGGDYYLDALWQTAFVDLEFESTGFHLDPLAAAALVAARDQNPDADPEAVAWRRELIAKADADRRRLRDIQYLGIQVIPVTTFDLDDSRRMDQVAYALAKRFWAHDRDGFCHWSDSLDEHSYRELRQNLLKVLAGDGS